MSSRTRQIVMVLAVAVMVVASTITTTWWAADRAQRRDVEEVSSSFRALVADRATVTASLQNVPGSSGAEHAVEQAQALLGPAAAGLTVGDVARWGRVAERLTWTVNRDADGWVSVRTALDDRIVSEVRYDSTASGDDRIVGLSVEPPQYAVLVEELTGDATSEDEVFASWADRGAVAVVDDVNRIGGSAFGWFAGVDPGDTEGVAALGGTAALIELLGELELTEPVGTTAMSTSRMVVGALPRTDALRRAAARLVSGVGLSPVHADAVTIAPGAYGPSLPASARSEAAVAPATVMVTASRSAEGSPSAQPPCGSTSSSWAAMTWPPAARCWSSTCGWTARSRMPATRRRLMPCSSQRRR